MGTFSTSGADTRYCSVYGHVRVWGGSAEARPKTCSCGAVKYVEHRCICGDVHEQQVSNEPYRGEVITRLIAPNPLTSVLQRKWDTPEEDRAWESSK